jgi:hypothetical protein
MEKGIDGVAMMVHREGNVEINGMSPVPLENGINGSTTLDETLGIDIVKRSLNKEKGSLKLSFTQISMGALGLIKGGLKFGGGLSSTTSTSTKPVSSNQI